ncbi:MAG: 16S rRNA (guanine(966)-N(2))-methyltransferase RsmD [Bacteroidales bacterium]|nr:16S rRNA (guanine(966)-N(2))-methyltransferase RsmD [Bacteroidales bacterium]
MRIIRGLWKSRRITPPNNLPVRPTTDFAKEALFNIFDNMVDYEDAVVLDLFSGTGSISYEFCSREAKSVTAVEMNQACISFIKSTIDLLQILNLNLVKNDVFSFIKKTPRKFDVIFADPPYQLPNLAELPQLVFEHQLLNENGIFVLEHSAKYHFENHPMFIDHRNYGSVNFSFFMQKAAEN